MSDDSTLMERNPAYQTETDIRAPLVSVVIPHWNHKSFIEERFQSVVDQTFQDFEIILLDDCSDDGSLPLLRKLANHDKVTHFIVNEARSGSAFRQWKKGIDLARGEYIWIAESDDSCARQFLATLIEKLEQNKKVALAYCQSWDVDTNGQRIENREYWTLNFSPNIWQSDFQMDGSYFVRNYLGVKNVVPNASAVVFRKSAIDISSWKVILDMHFVGDWFFWCKMLLRGDIAFINKTYNYFRAHGATTRMQDSYSQELKRLSENIELRLWLKTHIDDSQRYRYKGLKRKIIRTIRREVKYGSLFQIFRVSTFTAILKLIKLRLA